MLIAPFLIATVLAGSGCTPASGSQDRLATAFAAPAEGEALYRIGTGDELSVLLPYNAELNYQGPVGPDGRFTMPIGGAIPAAGKTVAEMEAAITKALHDRHIVEAAAASVTIRRFAQVVYVGGEVKLPGSIPLRNKMNPLQAISIAGGLLDTARSEQVVLIRQGPDGRPILRTVDIDAYVHTGDLAQTVALQPQDTIFVPKSSIAEVDQWIDQYINKTLPFNRSLNYTINDNPGSTVTP